MLFFELIFSIILEKISHYFHQDLAFQDRSITSAEQDVKMDPYYPDRSRHSIRDDCSKDKVGSCSNVYEFYLKSTHSESWPGLTFSTVFSLLPGKCRNGTSN
jgi:hypothetical protein